MEHVCAKLTLTTKNNTGGSDGLGIYIGVGGAVVGIVAVMAAAVMLIRLQKKTENRVVLLSPITIEMESNHASLKVMEDPHSFASGSSAADVMAANAAEGRDRIDTDILAPGTDSEEWEY